MANKVRCSACGKSMRLPDGVAGRAVVCLACGTKFRAPPDPQASTPPAADPAEAPPDWANPLEDLGAGVTLDEHRVVYRQRKPLTAGQRRLLVGASAGLVVLLVLGLLARAALRWGREVGQMKQLTQLRNEAETLRGKGELAAAHQKFRELDRRANELGAATDPKLRQLSEQARVDQRVVYKAMLEQAANPPPADDAAAATPAGTPAQAPPASAEAAVASARAPGAERVPPGIASLEPSEPVPGGGPDESADADEPGPTTSVAGGGRPPLQPIPEPITGVTDEQVGQSIQKGVDALIKLFDAKGQLTAAAAAGDAGYACGLNALAVYALLQSSQAITDPRLKASGTLVPTLLEGMKRLEPAEGKVTYARGIRATALALLNRPADRAALSADVLYLVKTHRNGAYHYAGDPNAANNSTELATWDNSNTQYGLLGVWSGAEVDIDVPTAYWAAVERHWNSCQYDDGTWGYHGSGGGSQSMTAGGTASLFVAEDYLYRAEFGLQVGREPFGPKLKKSLDWWGRGAQSVSITSSWWGYTLYGIERVGLASGFKHLGAHDWYRELAEQVIKRQAADGMFGNEIETSYALLFLSRGRHPIFMNKLRFDRGGVIGEQQGYWANRPRDASNLARFAGKQLERPLNWQVQQIDRPWQDWLDAPLLSIASHTAPFFTDAQCDKLRRYVEAGGLLFVQSDGDDTAEFDRFAKHLARRLFPQYPMRDLPKGHALYNLQYKVDPPVPLKYVTNGARVLMVYSPRDIAQHWQTRDEKGKAAIFHLGMNLFVYAAGKRELRNRLDSPHISAPDVAPPLGTFRVARVKYTGNWDPEPGAWRRYANWFVRQTGMGLQVDAVELKALRPGPGQVAHLTGTAAFKPSDAEVAALRAYVEGGGVLFVDACGGSAAFTKSARAALARAFPDDAPQTPSTRHPLLRAGQPGMEDLRRVRLRAHAQENRRRTPGGLQVLRAGKGHVVITPLDVTSGLLGTQTGGIYGYDPAYAQNVIKNVVFWTVDGQPSR